MQHPFRPSDQVRATLRAMNEASALGKPFFFVLDFELQEALFFPDPIHQHDGSIFFDFPSARTPEPPGRKLPIVLTPRPEPLERYQERFRIIHDGLMRGDSFLTNLTLRTPIETEASLEDIYCSSSATYRVLLPHRFVSFSPERFVTLRGSELTTHPMKGTIDARLPDAAERLRGDYKEGCEHHTIVDLMRNDLSRVSAEVHVRRFKYLTELHTSSGPLLQMSSEIVGQIDRSQDLALGDLLLELLPAGSISGAPKCRTVELIQEAEGVPRGFYTGVCGYFDGEALDSAVLIRFIEETSTGELFYRSGGGITINSLCQDEYHECLQKIYIPQS